MVYYLILLLILGQLFVFHECLPFLSFKSKTTKVITRSTKPGFKPFEVSTHVNITNEEPSEVVKRLHKQKENLNKHIAITFVNGIYHSVDEWKNLSIISEHKFGVKVQPFYNPSTGSWVKDATRAGFDLALRPNDLVLAKDLTAHFRRIFQELGPNGRILHLAHSGGAILTYIAAKYHLTIAETNRIDVVTFGAGKSITHKYFRNGRVYNYYARNDPLTLIDRRTNRLLKFYENNPFQKKANPSYGYIRDWKHNTTFCFL